jgi:hypothetical protein
MTSCNLISDVHKRHLCHVPLANQATEAGHGSRLMFPIQRKEFGENLWSLYSSRKPLVTMCTFVTNTLSFPSLTHGISKHSIRFSNIEAFWIFFFFLAAVGFEVRVSCLQAGALPLEPLHLPCLILVLG